MRERAQVQEVLRELSASSNRRAPKGRPSPRGTPQRAKPRVPMCFGSPTWRAVPYSYPSSATSAVAGVPTTGVLRIRE